MTASDVRIAEKAIERSVPDTLRVAAAQILAEDAEPQSRDSLSEDDFIRLMEGSAPEVGRLGDPHVGPFQDPTYATRLDERIKRATARAKRAAAYMRVRGVCTRKVREMAQPMAGGPLASDAIGRIARRLRSSFGESRKRPLSMSYPYIYLGEAVVGCHARADAQEMGVLVAIGVNDRGYREALTVESARGQTTDNYRSLLQGLVVRGLHGVNVVVSSGDEAVSAAVDAELPGASQLVRGAQRPVANLPADHIVGESAALQRVASY